MARIIVVDDEEDIRLSLQEVLERAGFDVGTTSNGEDGLKMLRASGADLVITDIIMPGKDGVATVREIRAEFPNTRIIVMSGGGNVVPLHTDASTAEKITGLAGADVTLTKPFSRGEILAAIQDLLEPA